MVKVIQSVLVVALLSFGYCHCKTISDNNDEERMTEVVRPKFDPTWESIDSRPLPVWYDQSKVGIFIHWGVYSVPSFVSEWFWKSWKEGSEAHGNFMRNNYKPGFTYQEFGPSFTAEFFYADEWAEIFRKSGAKYVVLTSKHHEGYTLWPSKYSFSWNSVDVGSHRDLLGELAQAVRKAELKFGLYYSLLEWFNPLYEQDMANNWATDEFVRIKSMPTLREVVNKYQPDVIWSDGEWEAPDTYWGSVEFLAWLYNESPVKDTVVVNDRWGKETRGKHGGFYNYDDRYNPGVVQPHKWENAMTIDKESWGHRRNTKIEECLTPEELMTTIAQTIACGGNILVNVGPSKDGMIPTIQQERLLQMGEWLAVNGEAIYDSVTWTSQNDTITQGIWYTSNTSGSKIYAMITNGWPEKVIHLGSLSPVAGMTVGMLGTDGTLQWSPFGMGISVTLPALENNKSKWVWTIVITLR